MRSDIDYDNMSSLEIWLSDISEDSATRVAAAVLIISGSLLGTIFGILAISANPAEILSGTLVSDDDYACLLYTSPSPRDRSLSRMPSSA